MLKNLKTLVYCDFLESLDSEILKSVFKKCLIKELSILTRTYRTKIIVVGRRAEGLICFYKNMASEYKSFLSVFT